MLCECVFMCACVCVSIHSQLCAKPAHSPLTPVFLSPTCLPPLSHSPCCPPILAFHHAQSWSSYPHYRRLGPKMSPMRLLLMLAPVSLHSQLCVQSLKAWFEFAQGISYEIAVPIPTQQHILPHGGKKYLIFHGSLLFSYTIKITPELATELLIPKQLQKYIQSQIPRHKLCYICK